MSGFDLELSVPDRRKYVVGNWKMNTARQEAVRLAQEVHAGLRRIAPAVDVGVSPPFVYLEAVGAALRAANSSAGLGAQNCAAEVSGAFTGEVSAAMVRDIGCGFVILGHSERRHVMGETDQVVARKCRLALEANLHVILCIGETLAEREAGQTDQVNERQVRAALAEMSVEHLARVTIAYEPVWAIGTGRTAKPADAQAAHRRIREVVAVLHGSAASQAVRIQYGGSVKPDNAEELFRQPDIDGGLIGGASLKSGEFLAIVEAASRSSG